MVKLRSSTEWARLMNVAVMDPDGWRVDGKSMDVPISRAEFEQRLMHSTICQMPPSNCIATSLMAVIELHGTVNLFKTKLGAILVRTANHFIETDNLLTALNRLRDPSFIPKSINRTPVESPAPQSSGS